MKNLYLVSLFCCFFTTPLLAQVANDDCVDAVALPEEIEYCSAVGEFTNAAATGLADPNDYPVCIEERDQMQDVWFSFVAQRTAADIQVLGNETGNVGGTLEIPQFGIYSGDCGTLTELGCRSPERNPQTGTIPNGGTIILTELEVGETYFILVGARNGNTGSFQLCVNQFDAIPSPSGDCETGVILCDKSPFSVDLLEGRGSVNDDILSDNIRCGVPPVEFNSAWYRWTCDQAGSLTFTITPLGAAFNEDIDFVLFELTGGLDDCGSKEVLRQMFSGETRGQGAANIPCLRETGLSDADQDVSENCGCDPGDNNFISGIDMVAGRSYALVIMNFSGSGDGFSIEWGGAGTFVGPEIDYSFSSSEVCVGESITFQDQSSSLDPIASWEWDFGTSATPQTATGPGPHEVVFGAPGTPSVELVIETERECREILSQREINVICCTGQFSATAQTSDVLCPNDITGAIDLTATSNFSPNTLTYTWSNNEMSEDLDNLGLGDYTVTVSDESGCEDTFTYTIGGPEPFTYDTLITMPDCAGGTNGALEFTVLGGGQGPYVYSFDNSPFSSDNRLDNIPIGTVSVRARDANNCLVDQEIFVDELQLGLRPGIPVFTEPICAGDATGSITVEVANGQPAYQYDFGLGDGFQTSPTRNGLAAGDYNITARDADGCTGIFQISVAEPPAINLAANDMDLSCFGADDGAITVVSSGGRPGYTYAWSDGLSTDTLRENLTAGQYTVSLTDENGCLRTTAVTIEEPNEIFPVLEQTNDLLCFGEATGSFLISATGGTPAYTYSSDGEIFQTDPLLANLLAGDYRLYVQDANGCLDSLQGSLNQPREFIVDPGGDARIFLGFDTILRAVSNYNPVSYQWGPDSLLCLDPPLCTRVRAAPVLTTLYTVVGTNDVGCTDTASVELTVIEDLPFYVPSAFSPNGDGANDGFTLFGGPSLDRINNLSIYDRWGELVFSRDDFLPNDPTLGWDGELNGKPMTPAVFVFKASIRFINGRDMVVEGDLTLVR